MSPATTVLAGVFLLAALYCRIDPFRRGIMADFPGFEVHHIELSPPSKLVEVADPEDRLRRSEIRFLDQVQGPESIAFDLQGRGPYTGVADGRVLFWNGEEWTDFAYTSPNRSEICDPKPSTLSYLKVEHICGRPLGLRFDKRNGDLYIADAYFGLLKVGPEGGLATSLSTEAGGVPLKFTNDLDIDEEGNVYFTDSSTKYQRRNFMQISVTGDPSGRLLKFNPLTKETTVLRGNLQFPNGMTLSKDRSFLLFCEGSRGRLHRYWLKGEKAGTFDVFAILPGYPDNVRTNDKGEFWVAIHCRFTKYAIFMSEHSQIRKFILKLPLPARRRRLHAMILKYSPDGEMLEVLEDREGKVVKAVSEVEEKDGKLWMGSVLMPFMAVY